MATPVVTYTFTPGTLIESAKVNQNFDDLINFLQNDTVHVDASNAFTAVPSGPATNPSSDNQLARKKYVDDADVLRLEMFGVGAHLIGGDPPTTGLKVQAGTAIGTLNPFNAFVITFPKPFPSGVLTVLAIGGDALGVLVMAADNVSLTQFTPVYNAGGGTLQRCNWLAIGY